MVSHTAAVALVALACLAFVNASGRAPAGDFIVTYSLQRYSLSPGINIFDRNLLNYDHYPIGDDWGMER